MLKALLAIPLLLPPYVSALAWIELLGTQGFLGRWFTLYPPGSGFPRFSVFNLGGAVLVMALGAFPLCAFATAAAVKRLDGRMLEAGVLYGGRGRAFWHIELPQLRWSLLSGAGAVFLLGLLSFAVPSLLQVQVYAVEIYTRFNSFYDTAGAAAQSLPLLALGTVVLLVLSRQIAATRSGPMPGRPRQLSRNAASHTTLILLSAVTLLLGVGLPLFVVTLRALPLSSLWEVWRSAGDEVLTSVTAGALAATVALVLALLMAWAERFRGGAFFSLSALSFLASGPVLGVGLILLWNRHGPAGSVYDSAAILVVACAARYLFLPHFGLRHAFAQLPRHVEEAAAASGASPRMQLQGVVLPLLTPALVLLWALVFVLSLSELDTVLLVAPPGWTPLSVRVFSLLHYGPSQLVAALSLLSVLLIFAASGLALLVWSALQKGRHVRS